MIIDYPRLIHSIKQTMHEREWGKYDFPTLASTATPCWDDTGIKVVGSDFTMIFDSISYELRKYEGFDIK